MEREQEKEQYAESQQSTSLGVPESHQSASFVKTWFQFWQRKKVAIPVEKTPLYTPGRETRCFKLTIQELEGVKFTQKDAQEGQTSLQVKFSLTFHTKTVQPVTFGRTYESCAYELAETTEGIRFKNQHPVSIYYHTSVSNFDQLLIAIQARVYETDQYEVSLSHKSIGWTSISALRPTSKLEEETKTEKLSLRNGSPRSLITKDINDINSSTGVAIQFMLKQCPQFDKVKHLVPDTVFVGSDEELPGVALNQDHQSLLPYHPLENQLLIQPPVKAYLSQVTVWINQSCEDQILKQAREYTATLQDRDAVQGITAIKLAVSFHNGWTFINGNGINNQLILKQDMSERNQKSRKGKDGLEIRQRIYTSHQPHEITNIYKNENCIVVLHLIYEIGLQTSIGPSATERIVGWLPFSIFNSIEGPGSQNRQLTITEQMIKGGKAIDGSAIIDIGSGDDAIVRVTAIFDIGQAPAGLNTQVGKVYRQDGKTASATGSLEEKELARQREDLSKREYQLRQLQERLLRENENPGGSAGQSHDYYPQPPPVLSYHPDMITTKDLDDRFGSLEEREHALIQEIARLREENDQIKLETSKGFENLAQLILDNKINVDALGQTAGKWNQTRGDGDMIYDQSEIDQWRVVEGITNVPRKTVGYTEQQDQAFMVQPDYGIRDLNSGDKVFLMGAGIKGLLDDLGDTGGLNDGSLLEERNLIQDLNDPLKSSMIVIQFLSLTPKMTIFEQKEDDSMTNYRSSIYSESYIIPARMYFTFYFFDMPLFETEYISYEQADDPPRFKDRLNQGKPFILMRETYLRGSQDYAEPMYQFDVDPSQFGYNNMHEDFVNYLYQKMLIIDIYDSDTLMLFGTAKIPLKGLLRQGKTQAMFAQEVDIVDPHMNGTKGKLQVMLKNLGQMISVQDDHVDQFDVMKHTGMGQDHKRSVRSEQPISVPSTFIKSKTDSRNNFESIKNEEERRQARIKQFKMAQLTEAIGDDIGFQDLGLDHTKKKELKLRQIQEIDNYQESQKQDVAQNVITQFMTDQKLVTVAFGKVQIVPFEVINEGNVQDIFSIKIDDPDEQYLPNTELEVVSKPIEWQYWCKQAGYPRPDEFQKIEDNKMLLAPGERITLLFKFLTFRIADYADTLSSGGGYVDDSKKTKYIGQRTINVFVTQSKGSANQGFKLRINPRNQIIDHTFRYNERESRAIQLVLPAIYYYSQPPKERPILHITQPTALVEWLNDRELSVEMKVPSVGNIARFHILAYNNAHFAELIGNWVIEVHSLEGIDINVNLGEITRASIQVPGDIPRYVKMHSSAPNILWFPAPWDKQNKLIAGTTTNVEIGLRSLTPQTLKVLVNCVDKGSKQLVHAWIITINTQTPSVSQILDVAVQTGVSSKKQFPYINRTSDWNTFNFQSSDKSILNILNNSVAIDGGKREDIGVEIMPQHQQGRGQVFVFVADKENRFPEVILFRITYSYTRPK